MKLAGATTEPGSVSRTASVRSTRGRGRGWIGFELDRRAPDDAGCRAERVEFASGRSGVGARHAGCP